MAEINDVIAKAHEELEYREKSWEAYNENPDVIYDKYEGAGYDNVTKYAKEMDDLEVYNTPKNGYPWCKVFIDWLFVKTFGIERAGQLLHGWTAGVEQFFNWFSENGQISNSPKIGDLVIFGDNDHIGIVFDVADGKIYTIEGNTSESGYSANGGQVANKEYYLESSWIKCYARPNYEGEPTPPEPPTPTYRTLYKGCYGDDVQYLQEKLIEKGYNLPEYGADKCFGDETLNAVIQLQKDAFPDNPEEWDGIVGEKTWAIIESSFVRPTSEYVLGLYQVDTPSGLNVRTSPVVGDIIKAYPDGTRFDTYEIDNNWARTPSGWVCLDYCILIEAY